MGFFGLIFAFLGKLAKKGQDLMRWLWSKAQDSDGKIKGVNPSKIPKVVSLIGLVALFVLLIIQVTKPDPKTTNGASEFEKEITPAASTEYRFDPTAIDPTLNGKLNGSNIDVDPAKALIDSIGNSSSSSGVLSVSDCLDVMNKMKQGSALSQSETDLANKCIAENPMGLTGDELKLAQKLLDPNLTAAERAFLTKALNNELTPEERDLALALASGDAEKAALAKAAINSGDPDVIKAAAKQIAGKELTEEEKALIAGLKTNPDSISKKTELDSLLNGGEKSSPVVSQSGATPEAVKDLSLGIADRDKDIAKAEKDLERAKKEAQEVASKIQTGTDLNESELKKVQLLAEKKKELDNLIKQQELAKKLLADKLAQMKETISRSMITVGGKNIPTGVFIEYDGEDQCSPKAKPFVKAKPKNSKTFVDLDNRPLNPEEVEFVKLMRKNGKTDVVNSGDSFNKNLGEPMLVAANGEVNIDTNQMIVFADKGVKDCELTPDMMIPAQIDSDILVSSTGSSQQVRMKVLMDVYCPTNNQQLLIAKGAIAIANAGSFDAETGIMNMTVNKLTSGGKNLSFSFNVASANGTSGLRGEVRDTTGKYLIGAFIPAFAGAALSYFSSQQVQPFLQSTQAAQAIQGAALAGSAEVMNKIAELAASKMLNAPKLFWVPKGIPVVLIPN